MKSIRVLFERVRETNPYFSDFVCLATAVEGKDFTSDSISRAFNKLVDKNDYFNGKKNLLSFLCEHTKKVVEDTKLESKSPKLDIYFRKG